MNKILIILVSTFIPNLFAQPGKTFEQKKQSFDAVTSQINKEPNNVDLRKQRLSRSQFDNTYIHVKEVWDGIVLKRFYSKPIDLLEDLNFIIANTKSIKYKFLRGRFFFITGKEKKALDIWLKLIENNKELAHKDPHFFNDINISIASYYYNNSKPNIKKALNYVNKTVLCDYAGFMREEHEQEKIMLYKLLNDNKGLANYYKSLILLEDIIIEKCDNWRKIHRYGNILRYLESLTKILDKHEKEFYSKKIEELNKVGDVRVGMYVNEHLLEGNNFNKNKRLPLINKIKNSLTTGNKE